MLPTAILISALLSQGENPILHETTNLPENSDTQGIEPQAAFDGFESLRKVRQEIADHGISANVNLTFDGGYNFTGGNRAGGYVNGLLSAALQIETEKLFGLAGGRFLVRWQTYIESSPGPYQFVADYWGYDSIASGRGDVNQISECYYQQKLFDDRLSVRFGKQDACDTFLNPLGPNAYFINNINTYPATLVPFLPTYPDQAMGVVITGKPTGWLELKTSWFDGTSAYSVNGEAPQSTGSVGPGTFFNNPGTWFFISEADARWTLDCGLDGSAGVGGWWQTGSSTVVGTNTPPNQKVSDSNSGWYLQATQWMYNADPSAAVKRGVQLYAQFGWGDPTSNPVQWSLASGFVFNGPLPGRDSDSFGVTAGYASFSANPTVYQSAHGLYELAIETYYNIAITNWMSLQPDLQVLISPLGESEMPTAVVGILRLSINF